MTTPLIFDLNGFSLDDGPGIRSTVFLKGCPLSCAWCHNPESWSPAAGTAFYQDLCIGCDECIHACPEKAISPDLPGRIDRGACIACGNCAAACPSAALRLVGKYYPPGELAAVLMKNRVFYETSGGGVTFSGGEPALHTSYLKSVMGLLKARGIHVVIQTSGMFDLERFASEVLPLVDIIHFDLKVMDPVKHRKWTGADNSRVLTNFRKLASLAHDRLIPRMPLVPGITATKENVKDGFAFINKLGYDRLTLLPFNPGGKEKRLRLGMPLTTGFPKQ